jgi:hypothetical protein
MNFYLIKKLLAGNFVRVLVFVRRTAHRPARLDLRIITTQTDQLDGGTCSSTENFKRQARIDRNFLNGISDYL